MADTDLAASPAKSPLVILADGEATTTSLAVAEFFGKQHRHVLRDIRNLIDQMGPGDHSPKFGQMIRLVKTGKGASRAEHYLARLPQARPPQAPAPAPLRWCKLLHRPQRGFLLAAGRRPGSRAAGQASTPP